MAVDLFANLDAAIDKDADPATVSCTVNPATARTFKVGDFVVFNDETHNPEIGYFRSYECAQIVGPGSEGDVVDSGIFQLQRAYPGVDPRLATFGTVRCAHAKGIPFFRLDMKMFTMAVKKGFFRTAGIPARIEAKLPSACVVAMLVGVANHFGFGPFTVFPLSHQSEPFMPGDRTCNGGAYTFQIPGTLAVANNVVIPMRVHDSASILCIYAYLQQPTTDGQSAYLVKVSRDDGATWELLEYMGIAEKLPDGYKNTYDFLVDQGYGKPATRRLPYNDFGIVTTQAIVAGSSQQTVQTASHGASRLGFDVGEFVHINLGGADEEYVQVLAADSTGQMFTAIFTKSHSAGATVRPTIWPTQILNEGDSLAFDTGQCRSCRDPPHGVARIVEAFVPWRFCYNHLALTSCWPGNISRYCTIRGEAPRFGVAPCGNAWCHMIKSPASPAIGIARNSLCAIARGSAPAGISFSHVSSRW